LKSLRLTVRDLLAVTALCGLILSALLAFPLGVHASTVTVSALAVAAGGDGVSVEGAQYFRSEMGHVGALTFSQPQLKNTMAKPSSGWMNMGRAGPKNEDGSESEPTYPTITMHGDGDAPALTDGPYVADMKHLETRVTTDGNTGAKTHHVTMRVHRMKPMDQPPQTMQGPGAAPAFGARRLMDARVANLLKSKAAPTAVTPIT